MLVVPAQWTSAVPGQKTGDIKMGTDRHMAGVLDVVGLGFNLVIPGIIYGWAGTLGKDFSIVLGGYFLAVVGYLTLALCIAEMASFFPFGGGSFGYARCIISPTLGFLIGVCEIFEYVLFVVAATGTLAGFCTIVFETSADLDPVWWTVFFVVSVFLQALGGQVFWGVTRTLSVVSVTVILFYFFSMLHFTNAPKYTPPHGDPTLDQGMYGFVQTFPLMVWIFAGLEGLVLAAEDVNQPKKAIPRAAVGGWMAIFFFSTLVFFVAVTAYPGTAVLSGELEVMTVGLTHVFKWLPRVAVILSMPTTFGGAFSFLYAAGKRVASMAASKVLPWQLGFLFGTNRTPLMGLLFAASFALGILFLLREVDPQYGAVALNTCLLFACFVYTTMAACYLICSDRYSNLPRQFTSPLGRVGAVYCAVCFTMGFIGLAFFQDDLTAFVVFVVFLAAMTFWYWLVVRRHEYFSEEEVTTFMKAYIINANLRRKQEIKRRSKQRMVSLQSSAHGSVGSPKARSGHSGASAAGGASSLTRPSHSALLGGASGYAGAGANGGASAGGGAGGFTAMVMHADGAVVTTPH